MNNYSLNSVATWASDSRKGPTQAGQSGLVRLPDRQTQSAATDSSLPQLTNVAFSRNPILLEGRAAVAPNSARRAATTVRGPPDHPNKCTRTRTIYGLWD